VVPNLGFTELSAEIFVKKKKSCTDHPNNHLDFYYVEMISDEATSIHIDICSSPYMLSSQDDFLCIGILGIWKVLV
jgi:hypothetical protein